MTQRIKRHPFLALFDGADPNSSTGRRDSTTVPTQALFFLNDPFVHARADSLARRLAALPDDAARLDRAVPAPLRPPAPRREIADRRPVPRRRGRRATAPRRLGGAGSGSCSRATNSSTSIDRSEGSAMPSNSPTWGRRGFVRSAVAGTVLFPAILSELLAAGEPSRAADPLAPRPPHFPAQGEERHLPVHERRRLARRFVRPQAELVADHGKQVALDHPETRNRPGYEKLFLKRPDWEFARHGESGIEVSTLFPHIGRVRRRPRPDPLDARRPLEPLQRHARHAHRVVQPGPAEHRLVGQLRARHREPEPAVVRRDRPADALRRRRRSGRPTSCPAATRGRSSSPAPSRCGTSAR